MAARRSEPRRCGTATSCAARDGEPDLLYIDLHLVHEVTSPQAFDGLRLAGRPRPPARPHRRHRGPQRPDRRTSTSRSPTRSRRKQVEVLRGQHRRVRHHPLPDGRPRTRASSTSSGPSRACTQPGMTIVCGDSHTSTHGAFGALAFGIGTSEVEHVLATQTLPQARPGHDGRHRRRRAARRASPPRTSSSPSSAASAPAAASAHVIEYRGSAIRGLSMEGRMTVCNMSIEAGAKAGLIAPDDTTFAYLEGRAHAPTGAAWDAAARRLAHARHRRRRHLRQGGAPRRRRASRRTSPGAPTPAQVVPLDGVGARPPTTSPTPNERDSGRAGPRVHGPHGRHADARRRRRHRVHRLVHQPPHRGPAGRRRGGRGPAGDGRRAHPGRARLVRGEGTRPRPRASTRSSPPPASTGASRAARCAWP